MFFNKMVIKQMNYQKAKENNLKYWEYAQIATSKKKKKKERDILCTNSVVLF